MTPAPGILFAEVILIHGTQDSVHVKNILESSRNGSIFLYGISLNRAEACRTELLPIGDALLGSRQLLQSRNACILTFVPLEMTVNFI